LAVSLERIVVVIAVVAVIILSKLVNEKGWAKRNAIESEIRAVRMALAHYLAALDLESTLRGGGINILRADTVGRSRGFAMRRFHAMTFRVAN
jgi:hypothetical protein